MSWLHDKTTELLRTAQEAKDKKAFPFFRRFENIGPRVKIGRGSYINFTSNDYLGLSQHPKLIRRSIAGTARYGTGLGSSRLQATSVRHEELEQELGRWLGFESCVVCTTGYQALVATLSTFLDGETTVVLDNFSHASILDGVFLAKGQHPELEIRFIKHNSVRALERVLKSTKHDKKLVVVEGLYSVDGDAAPLADIVTLCRQYDAALMVDDAHGIGSLGMTGRGLGEVHGVMDEIDLLVGTFSKSFGAVGGFICADRVLVDYIKLQARAFVYSASLPLAQVEAAAAALELLQEDPSYLARLRENAAFFREGLAALGVNVGQSTEHITPIMVGDEEKAMTFGAYLYHGAGVIMLPFIYPGVPKGTARLRCNVTAAHSRSDMGYALEALGQIGRMLEILPSTARTRSSELQRAVWLARNKIDGVRNAGVGYLWQELQQARGKVGQWTRTKLSGNPPAV